MKNNFTFLFIFILLSQLVTAQVSTEKWIKGQITSNFIPLEAVNITNSNSKRSAVSDSYGNFSVLAKEGDILNFSIVNYDPLRKYINKQEFNLGSIVINMTAMSVELSEVIINKHPEISAENMGLISKGQVKLTPAERKLNAGSGGIVGVINALTGELENLKKNIIVEKKEILMHKLEFLFEDKYYIDALKIPEEQIKGFQYYCVEDLDFENALNSKNKTMSMFLIVGLASNYNKNRASDQNDK
ncbi:carboxypeptidase-like regulatory domain-containing protein [Flavobacterium sp. N3904]|uniref:carboxypeptidase-like regulatory domain-containing protein n=1 Tax=Flavobacterium sp. N3904 TaxID=2986835 RepID=UPI002223EF7D|nr:carboxypeptidase-like regulatory domain-containing protein [Flavobacterium sp. N3904]